MSVYLLDTTFLIHLWESVATAIEWYTRAREDHVLASLRSRRGSLQRFESIDRSVGIIVRGRPVWTVSMDAATWAGKARYDLARQGIQTALPDALIAGVAIEQAAIVVTANVKDFVAMGLEVVRIDRDPV